MCFHLDRYRHHRFVSLKLRITNTGKTTTDVRTLWLYSCFADATEEEVAEVGKTGALRCTADHLNPPVLLPGVLSLALEHPEISMDTVSLAQQPLFYSISARTQSGAVAFPRPKTPNEVNARFAADLSSSVEQLVNGERPFRMYGFRRGGAQDLLDKTGDYELVMCICDWSANSDSLLVYLSKMNCIGTLRNTMRTYKKEEVTEVVSKIVHAHKSWVLWHMRQLPARAVWYNTITSIPKRDGSTGSFGEVGSRL